MVERNAMILGADGDWVENRNMVLAELHRLSTSIDKLAKSVSDSAEASRKQMLDVQISIATLQVKSSLWGACAGVMVSLAAVLLKNM